MDTAAATARFFSAAGLIVRVFFNDELGPDAWLQQLSVTRSHIDGSVLRYDLPVALATNGPREYRVGIVLRPKDRSCAYAQDASKRPMQACSDNRDEYAHRFVAYLEHQCGERHHVNISAAMCCSTNWEIAFHAKRVAAASANKCVRFWARQHNQVSIAFDLASIDAVFYKAYEGETLATSEVRIACRSARRLANAIEALRAAVDHNESDLATPVSVLRITMPLRRVANRACVTLPGSPNASSNAPSDCWSSQDDKYRSNAKTQDAVSPVREAEC